MNSLLAPNSSHYCLPKQIIKRNHITYTNTQSYTSSDCFKNFVLLYFLKFNICVLCIEPFA